MLNNIKLIGILFLSILLLTNCKKESKQDDQASGEIVFAAIDADLEKNNIFDIDCVDGDGLSVTHARVKLNDNFYYPAVFEFNGKLYTESIKLDVGSYEIKEFSLMDGTPEDGIVDVVIKSTPMSDSYYAQFLTPGFAIGDLALVDIAAFQKSEFDVEVLCYIEAAYDGFGFVWFDVTEITVREQCFFGDFCIKDVSQYYGSDYELDNIVTIDEKAIFMIKSYHSITGADDSWTLLDAFENFDGSNYVMDGNNYIPLCVEYADRDAYDDFFKFELYIYVTSGTTWGYVHFHDWFFKDAELIEDQVVDLPNDGVVDFVLGNCVVETPDLLLPPWMNLPEGSEFDFTLSNGNFGGDGGSYWDMNISGLPDGYDLWNGDYQGWCADESIGAGGSSICRDAFSSLYPDLLPHYWITGTGGAVTRPEAICAANWLWNNLVNMDNSSPITYNGTVVTAEQVQNALWHLFNNKSVSGLAWDMANDAKDHCDYSPLPGGWAAIFFVPCDQSLQLQMTFFIVDP